MSAVFVQVSETPVPQGGGEVIDRAGVSETRTIRGLAGSIRQTPSLARLPGQIDQMLGGEIADTLNRRGPLEIGLGGEQSKLRFADRSCEEVRRWQIADANGCIEPALHQIEHLGRASNAIRKSGCRSKERFRRGARKKAHESVGRYNAQNAARLVSQGFARASSIAKGPDAHVQALLHVHFFRFFGLAALLPGIFDLAPAGFSEAYRFQIMAGDVLVAALAPIAAFLFQIRSPWRFGFLWSFNIVGTLDYLNAVARATPSIQDANISG